MNSFENFNKNSNQIQFFCLVIAKKNYFMKKKNFYDIYLRDSPNYIDKIMSKILFLFTLFFILMTFLLELYMC